MKKPFSKAEWYVQNRERLLERANARYAAKRDGILAQRKAKRDRDRELRGQLQAYFDARLRGGVTDPAMERVAAERERERLRYRKYATAVAEGRREAYWSPEAVARRKATEKAQFDRYTSHLKYLRTGARDKVEPATESRYTRFLRQIKTGVIDESLKKKR